MLYFVRHGSTDWNDNKDKDGNKDARIQGRTNIPLNDRGREQAKKISEELKNVSIDKVFCSPLLRAKETCDIICRGKYPITYDDRLIERSFGALEGTTMKNFDFSVLWQSDKNAKIDGMETFNELQKRVYGFLKDVEKNYPDKNVLVVSHGGVGVMIASYFENFTDFESYLIPNGTYLQFDFEKTKNPEM